MKKLIIIAVIALTLVVPVNLFQGISESAAAKGCCMQRNNLNSTDWRPNGMGFSQCRDVNQQRDRDDLYRPIGYFWWNVGC